MSQPIRICTPNTIYHCTSRCIELRNLFTPAFVKNIAIIAINLAMKKYDFRLLYVKLANNHIDIVIKTTARGETISRILQYIKARIAERYNKMTNRTGAFWNERFKSRILEKANYIINILQRVATRDDYCFQASLYSLITKWFKSSSILKIGTAKHRDLLPSLNP
jgi:REP element-mobilizing transposase RayT